MSMFCFSRRMDVDLQPQQDALQNLMDAGNNQDDNINLPVERYNVQCLLSRLW